MSAESPPVTGRLVPEESRADGESALDVAARAGSGLLAERDLDPESVDAVLLNVLGEYAIPRGVEYVCDRLGVETALATTVDAGCVSALQALVLGNSLLNQPGYGTVLVLCCVDISRVRLETVSSDEYRTGVGAAVLTDGGIGVRDAEFAVRGEYHGYKRVASTGEGTGTGDEEFVYADGETGFSFRAYRDAAREVPPQVVRRVLERNDLSVSDVDRFVFHQSPLADHWTADLGVTSSEVPRLGDGDGWTNAGSPTPLILAGRVLADEGLSPDDLIGFCEIGLGMNVGVVLCDVP